MIRCHLNTHSADSCLSRGRRDCSELNLDGSGFLIKYNNQMMALQDAMPASMSELLLMLALPELLTPNLRWFEVEEA